MISFRSLYLDAPAVSGRILDFFDAHEFSSRPTALFFIHGGGWRGGSRSLFHPLALAYRELGFDCASTDYRLGETRIFDQIADVQESLHHFARDLQHRGRAANITLIGSSAGAHLALMAALRPPLHPPCYHLTGICLQAAPFTFEPWPDIFPAIWKSMQTAVGSPYESHPELYRQASPLHCLNASLPPVFALHAENEHMFPWQLTEDFAAKARSFSTPVSAKIYPATEHGFFYALDRWQQREAFQDILDFIEATTAGQVYEPTPSRHTAFHRPAQTAQT